MQEINGIPMQTIGQPEMLALVEVSPESPRIRRGVVPYDVNEAAAITPSGGTFDEIGSS